jgi:hypothetical protein
MPVQKPKWAAQKDEGGWGAETSLQMLPSIGIPFWRLFVFLILNEKR